MMRWVKQLGLWLALAVVANAVPIKPDLQKILSQPTRPKYYEPARAGWNGPEMVRPQDASPNSVYDAYGPASTVRMIRASLIAALTPEPVALGAIGMLIIMLRYLRQRRFHRERAMVIPIRRAEAERQKAA